MNPLDFLESEVGQFRLYYSREFPTFEAALSQILMDGANVIVLNTDQDRAIRLLHRVIAYNPQLTLVYRLKKRTPSCHPFTGSSSMLYVAIWVETNHPLLGSYPVYGKIWRCGHKLLCCGIINKWGYVPRAVENAGSSNTCWPAVSWYGRNGTQEAVGIAYYTC